jgi:hypothetical protein
MRVFPAVAATYLLLVSCGTGPNSDPNVKRGGGGNSIGGVLTWHGDNARTGANTSETTLTPPNVNSNQFGKKFSYDVDGEVVAQPLVATGVSINGSTKNVLIVATEHDSVYAFDADSKQAALWHVSFIDPAHGITTFPVGSERDFACCFDPEIGITGTPAIDPSTGTIYLVVRTLENGKDVQRLHALDIRNGNEKSGSPVTIQASVPGSTPDAVNGSIAFNPGIQNQRPGLLLANGILYIAWGSHNDRTPYHGWVMAYKPDTLQQVGVFLTTPDGLPGTGRITESGGSGIWMSGGGPAADASGNVYVTIGNGAMTVDSGGHSYSNAFLKFAASSSSLSLADYFEPHDALDQNLGDMDLGSGAAVVIDQSGAVPHLVLGTGKNGTIYSINRDNMGKFHAVDDSHAVQTVPNALAQYVRSSPAYWNGTLYVSSLNDHLKAFHFNDGRLPSSPTSQTAMTFPFPGPTPTISSNGTSNAIVWAMQHSGGVVTLFAFTADLSTVLYNSNQAGARDQGPAGTRFTVPVVINGKVYIGGRGEVAVYGLL